MNCPKCNAVNNQDAKFCGSCGYNLQSAPQSNQNNEVEEILEEHMNIEAETLTKQNEDEEVAIVKQEEIKTNVIKEETTKKTQELVLPNNQYNANGNLQFYYNPYYYYQQNSRYRRR